MSWRGSRYATVGSAPVCHKEIRIRTEVERILEGVLREHSGGGPAAELKVAINVAIGHK